jgi:uncharacterized protein YuzE
MAAAESQPGLPMTKHKATVEIDPAVAAAYVYLYRKGRSARRSAMSREATHCRVVVDFESKGNVIGFELVGLPLEPD